MDKKYFVLRSVEIEGFVESIVLNVFDASDEAYAFVKKSFTEEIAETPDAYTSVCEGTFMNCDGADKDEVYAACVYWKSDYGEEGSSSGCISWIVKEWNGEKEIALL